MQGSSVYPRPYRSVSMGLVFGLAALLLVALAAIRIGSHSSFMLLYLVPVSVGAWLFGRITGFLMAVAGTIASLLPESAAVFLSAGFIPPRILADGTITLIVFATATLWLARIKATLKNERALARTDFTTGAMNKRYLHDMIEMEIRRFKRYQRTFTVGMIDLDNFKSVNDRFGHPAGDDILRLVAETLGSNLRDTDTVARIGGDEFALLLPETDAGDAATVLSHTRLNLLAVMEQRNYPVTFSIGVVTFRNAPGSVRDALRQADALMYRVKRQGKNRINHQVYPA